MVNTSPAAFWTLFMIFATPGLLVDIRSEIDAVTRVFTKDGTQHRHLDVAGIKENCPLLASTYQEILRWRSVGMSVRRVNEDHLLDGKWLLKKGALVQMPVRAIHLEPTIWGTDVEEFNPRRFLKGEKQMTESGKRPKDSCFRSFGGGKTLCPGRHFATNEVLAFTSMFVARFDMEPQSGSWVLPPAENTVAASLLMTPDEDIAVSVRRRAGMEECKWTMTLEEAGKVFALVSEDQE
jgi:cytochrome P450